MKPEETIAGNCQKHNTWWEIPKPSNQDQLVQNGHAPSKTSEATSVAHRRAWKSYIQNSHASTQKRLAILSSCTARPAKGLGPNPQSMRRWLPQTQKELPQIVTSYHALSLLSSRPLQQVLFELHRGRNGSVSRLFVSN